MKILKPLLLTLIIATFYTLNAQIAINTDGSSADASAILDVKSTEKGMLIPRLTETQRDYISNPAIGLMIFQTDKNSGFYFYNGTTWGIVSSPNNSESHFLGQEYLNGIIFNLYDDDDGIQHGSIVSKTETTASWSNTYAAHNSNSSWDGEFNTNRMTDSPVKTFAAELGDGWYIPSIDEFNILWINRFFINKALNDLGMSQIPVTGFYWTSNEHNDVHAYYFKTEFCELGYTYKTESFRARAIKSF